MIPAVNVDVETPREVLARARRALAVIRSAEQWAERAERNPQAAADAARNPQAAADAARQVGEAAVAAALDLADAFAILDPLLGFAPPSRRARRGFLGWLRRLWLAVARG